MNEIEIMSGSEQQLKRLSRERENNDNWFIWGGEPLGNTALAFEWILILYKLMHNMYYIFIGANNKRSDWYISSCNQIKGKLTESVLI